MASQWAQVIFSDTLLCMQANPPSVSKTHTTVSTTTKAPTKTNQSTSDTAMQHSMLSPQGKYLLNILSAISHSQCYASAMSSSPLEIAADVEITSDNTAFLHPPATEDHRTETAQPTGHPSPAGSAPPKTQTNPLCENCTAGNEAILLCETCWKCICEECNKLHQSLTIYKSHKLQPMEHYFNMMAPKCQSCKKIAVRFCNDCRCCICAQCEKLHHKHHLVELEGKKAPQNTCMCSSCFAGKKATMHCCQCNTNICNECSESHKSLKIFAGHKLQVLKEASEDKLEDKEEASEDEEKYICGACSSGDKATSYCKSCDSGICESCTRSHQQLKVFSDHTVTAISSPPKCGACRSGQSAKGHCTTCNSYICASCIKQHKQLLIFRGHDVASIATVQAPHKDEAEGGSFYVVCHAS